MFQKNTSFPSSGSKTRPRNILKNMETVNVQVQIQLGLHLTVTRPGKYMLKELVTELPVIYL
jgi:hypothetical protein